MIKKTPSFEVTYSTLHLLHRAGQVAEVLFEKANDAGLTTRQFIVLAVVASSENPSQTTICARTGIDRSTMAEIVRRLVSRGLLARRRTREDARMYAIRLTDAGREALERTLPLACEVDQILFKPLTSKQRQDFESSLRRIVEGADLAAAA